MIKRFREFKNIVLDLTGKPETIEGLKQAKIEKLRNFSFTSRNWDILQVLEETLSIFHSATVILSGSSYETLASAFFVEKYLKSFLCSQVDSKLSRAASLICVKIRKIILGL